MKRLLFCIVFLLTLSCSKITESDIPLYRVYLTVDLRYEDKELVGALHYKEFTKPRLPGEAIGYSGILVICGNDNIYYAFDLCCPHEAKKNIKIAPTDLAVTVTAKCPECGTVYDLSFGNGNPTEGPSKFALRRYTVVPKGQQLIIQN